MSVHNGESSLLALVPAEGGAVPKASRESDREVLAESIDNASDNIDEGSHEYSSQYATKKKQDPVERSAMRKTSFRMLPMIFLTTFVLQVDKTNLSYASEGLMDDLDISDEQYGLIASVFFITYAVFGIPSSVIATRCGVKYSLPVLLLSFGGVSMLMASARSVASLCIVRLILGAAEAGVVPTMLTHVSSFYGPESMGLVWEATAGLAIGVNGLIGGPIAALILKITKDSKIMAGWQWLFIIEGLPVIVVAALVLIFLPNSPSSCQNFLSIDEQASLMRKTDKIQEDKQMKRTHLPSESKDVSKDKERATLKIVSRLLKLATDKRILLLIAGQFLWTQLLYGVIFWVPVMLSNGKDMTTAALLTAIPNVTGTITSLIVSWNSDRTRERPYHMAIALAIASVGFSITSFVVSASDPPIALKLFTIAISYGGIGMFPGPAVAAAGDILPSSDSALGFGLIDTFGTLGEYFTDQNRETIH